MCALCATYIDLTDFKISTTFSRSIQTQGALIVTSKGEVTSTKVSCGSAIIEGKVRGNLNCSGAARIRLKGSIAGCIDTQHLVVEKNSDVEFIQPVHVGTAEINGKAAGRVMAEGVVTINKSGSLAGAVYARGITIEKGGIFHGDLYIGENQVEQSKLLLPPPVDPPPLFQAPKGGTFAFG